LSAPATIVYQLDQKMGSHSSLRLAILMAYMTGFHWFFYLGTRYKNELMNGDPALVYYQKALHHFGKLTGDPQVG